MMTMMHPSSTTTSSSSSSSAAAFSPLSSSSSPSSSSSSPSAAAAEYESSSSLAVLSSAVVYIGIIDRQSDVKEGHEADKVVSFYPSSTPVETIANVAGLAEALATFASIFTTPSPSPSPSSSNTTSSTETRSSNSTTTASTQPSLAHAMSCDHQRHVFVSPEGEEEDFIVFCVLSHELSASHAPTWALRRLLKEALRTVQSVLGTFRTVLDVERRRFVENNRNNNSSSSSSSDGTYLRQTSALTAALAEFVVPMVESCSVSMATGLSCKDGSSRQVHASLRAAVFGDGHSNNHNNHTNTSTTTSTHMYNTTTASTLAAQRLLADVQRRVTGVIAASGAAAAMVIGMNTTTSSGKTTSSSMNIAASNSTSPNNYYAMKNSSGTSHHNIVAKEVWSTLSDKDSAMVLRLVECVLAPAAGLGNNGNNGGLMGSSGTSSGSSGGSTGIMNRMRKKSSSFLSRKIDNNSRRRNFSVNTLKTLSEPDHDNATTTSNNNNNNNNSINDNDLNEENARNMTASSSSPQRKSLLKLQKANNETSAATLSFCPFTRAHWKRRSTWIDLLTLSYDLEHDRAGQLPVISIDDGRVMFGMGNDCSQANGTGNEIKGRKRRVALLPCVGKEIMLILFMPIVPPDTDLHSNNEINNSINQNIDSDKRESAVDAQNDEKNKEDNNDDEIAKAKTKAKAKAKIDDDFGVDDRTNRNDGKDNKCNSFISDDVIDYIGVSSLQDRSQSNLILTAVREMHSLEMLLYSSQSQMRLSRDELNGHVTGYRYFFRNCPASEDGFGGSENGNGVSMSSPPQKVSKMSAASVAVVRGIREQFSSNTIEGTRYGYGYGSDHHYHLDDTCAVGAPAEDRTLSNGYGDIEMFVRTANDAWVILRRFGPRELIVVLERAGETLLEAAAALKYFASRHFRGLEIYE